MSGFSYSVGQAPATQTNDNAAAGKVGEVISSTLAAASGVTLTTGIVANVTSISLTAGDWDVAGLVGYDSGATTNMTVAQMSISQTSATRDTNPGFAAGYASGGIVPGSNIYTLSVGPVRKSFAVTTTIFLVALCNFTVSTMKAYGYIQARRAR